MVSNIQKYSTIKLANAKRLRVFPLSMLLVPVLVLGLRLASEPTANLSYFVLAVWAMTGRAQAVQALFLSWVITMFNPGLAPPSSLGAIGRYVVILSAMASVLLRVNFSGGKMVVGYHVTATLLLGLFLIIHSLFVSAIPDVSILKSVSFLIVFVTLLSAWRALTPLERVRTEMFVFGGLIAVALVSLPFIVTGVGYLRNNTGFQGILNQPNAFGPFVALLGIWLVGRFVSEKKMPLWQIGVLLLIPILIFASEARTAGGALALGFAVPILLILVFRPHRFETIMPGLFTGRFVIAVWAGTFGLLALSTVLFAQLDHYISKSGRSFGGSNLTLALEASRGGLVEKMFENIREYPIGGIGFGIGSFPDEMVVSREAFTGLPLGASIEKGVMPVAIVEEMGIPGAILVFGWFVMLIRQAGRNSFTSLMVIMTTIFVNLGENMFFSVGGMGLIIMVLATWAATPKKIDQQILVSSWIR